MRSFTLRCLVLLLSLALINGNAHAELYLGAMPADPCPAELGHHHCSTPHQHNKTDLDRCCCDCLGCVSAIELRPDVTSFRPAFFVAAVFYGETSPFLAGQILRPDPGPPRTGALS
jgi:hypothetical protein